MKKINSSSPFANTYIYMYVAATNMYIYMYVAAATLIYCLTLFLQVMTYDKEARRIAGHDYVREITRWPGHVRIINIPVEYAQEQYYVHYQSVHISKVRFYVVRIHNREQYKQVVVCIHQRWNSQIVCKIN